MRRKILICNFAFDKSDIVKAFRGVQSEATIGLALGKRKLSAQLVEIEVKGTMNFRQQVFPDMGT